MGLLGSVIDEIIAERGVAGIPRELRGWLTIEEQLDHPEWVADVDLNSLKVGDELFVLFEDKWECVEVTRVYDDCFICQVLNGFGKNSYIRLADSDITPETCKLVQ